MPLSVVVVYSDTATRERALRIHDYLLDELGDDVHAQFTWWKFDFLRHPEMFEAAVQAAVQADLLIFSVHAGDTLPAAVQVWIDAWRSQREQRESALIALFGGTEPLSPQSAPAHAYLQGLAQEAGMEFFPHASPKLPEAPCCLVDTFSERAVRVTPLLEEILTRKPAVPDWGINESSGG